MKITDSENIRQLFEQKSRQSGSAGDTEFEEILNEKMDTSGPSKPASSTTAPLHSISDIRLTPQVDRNEAIAQVESFLETMEDYSLKLSSSQVSLKEISPIVAKMEAGTREMKRLSEILPPGDEVKEILDQSLIRSSVEAIKFNRGDYL